MSDKTEHINRNWTDRELVRMFIYSEHSGMRHMAERLEAALNREEMLLEDRNDPAQMEMQV